MDFLNNFFLPPSEDHLHLLQYILMLVYFIHIPFISLLLGGSFFSVFFRLLAGNDPSSTYWRLSKDFVETLVFRKTAGVILGVLPLMVLVAIEGQILYDANVSVVQFLSITAILAAIGITLTYFYQRTFQMAEINPSLQLTIGGGGVMILFLAYFLFSVSSALVLDPGRWAVVNNPQEILFSWNVVTQFLHFICAAFAVSGVAMLFFKFSWQESQIDMSPDYANNLIKVAGGIALGFTLIQPVLLLWNLITLPNPALSEIVFGLSITALVFLLAVSLTLYSLLKNAESGRAKNAFILFIITFLIMIVNDHYARGNAIENHISLLAIRAEEVASSREMERESLMTTSTEPDLELGAQVFNNQCNSCHRFGQKLVGPPYNEVLPKYQGQRDKLAEFIRNPYKVDENYPPMPNLGLTEKQVQSVISYLFQRMEEQPKN